jgi:hypothetical protein
MSVRLVISTYLADLATTAREEHLVSTGLIEPKAIAKKTRLIQK